VSDTATRNPETVESRAARSIRRFLERTGRWPPPKPLRRFSLTRRLLIVNMLAVILLGGGMLYLDRYERGLIDTELQALATQGGIFAAALGEGAVLQDIGEEPVLARSLAQGMVRRLTEAAPRVRARLFMPDNSLAADSQSLEGPGGTIQIEDLPPPVKEVNVLDRLVEIVSSLLPQRNDYPRYVERIPETAFDYIEVLEALSGRVEQNVRFDPGSGRLVLSMAVPVRRYKQVLGALMLSTDSTVLEKKVTAVRSEILRLFLFSVVFTVLMSLYLAGTIVRPVRRLAQAAEDVRYGDGRKVEIPDFSRRGDEIGDLSVALADMTDALWRRMDAIEHFAADVAHEIKNPLTSLRSAVETVARVKEPERQAKLLAIILDDVHRLDRLISDISDASRLDAEMSRLERSPVSISGMLATLADMESATRHDGDPMLDLALPDAADGDGLVVWGKETRLVQVFRNLIANAVSFSPPDGRIRIAARADGAEVLVTIDDDGPGVPPGKLAAIFDRFYSERPAGEKFGTHSGLGLSISKQIVEAHGGNIAALNRIASDGGVIGARFSVRLPMRPEP
jgi:two-component system sensor histidine kinase ChvG